MVITAAIKFKNRKKYKASGFRGFERYELQKEEIVSEIVAGLYSDDPDARLTKIAERSQISVSTLRNLNTGRTRFPRMDTLWKMATAAKLKIKVTK